MQQSRTFKVLILSSGQALTALVALLSGVVLTRLLTQNDFGTYRQAVLAISFATPFFMLGLDRVLFAFLPGEQKRPRAVLIENLLLLVVAGMLLAIAILLGANRLLAQRYNNPELASLLSWSAVYPIFVFPALAIGGCLLARQRAGELATYNVGSRLLAFLVVVTLVYFWRTPEAAMLGMVIGAAVSCAVALWLMWRACPGPLWQPTRLGMRHQLAFAIPLGLSTLIGTLSLTLDQVLVSMRSSVEAFAVYAIGAMEIPLIGIITGSITSVVLVDYTRYYKENRIPDILRLMHRAQVKSALILFPAMIFLWFITPSMMLVLYGPQYANAAVPFRIYLLMLPIRTLTFGAVIQATGDSRPILVQSVLGFCANVVLGWTLIGVFGPAGAAVGSVAATYLVSVPYLIIVIKGRLGTTVRSVFPWRDLAKIMLASAIPLAVMVPTILSIAASDIVLLILAVMIYFPILLLGYIGFRVVDMETLYSVTSSLGLRRRTS
jgi:O-antigen/teichoic acid export membrane protein